MRAGVMVAIGGTVAVLVATGPASAFNSGIDPETYYNPAVSAVEGHREWATSQGQAFQPASGFTQRLPDDEFDGLLLSMINQYRAENGLPSFSESEELRVQSAIWSNRTADANDPAAVDWWSALDVKVVCSTVSDLYSATIVSAGNPGDAFAAWTAKPAVRNALLTPGPAWAGIGSVVAGDDREWTTMRIVHGDCAGGSLPYQPEPVVLPTPEIDVRQTLGRFSPQLVVSVDRRGEDQQLVELQHHDGRHWVGWRMLYLVPGQTAEVPVPPGRYRVTVPAQSGYDTAFTAPIDVA